MLEKALIHVEADEELIGRSIRQDNPTAGGDQRGEDRPSDNPAYLLLHRSPRRVIGCPGESSGSAPGSPPSSTVSRWSRRGLTRSYTGRSFKPPSSFLR